MLQGTNAWNSRTIVSSNPETNTKPAPAVPTPVHTKNKEQHPDDHVHWHSHLHSCFRCCLCSKGTPISRSHSCSMWLWAVILYAAT